MAPLIPTVRQTLSPPHDLFIAYSPLDYLSPRDRCCPPPHGHSLPPFLFRSSFAYLVLTSLFTTHTLLALLFITPRPSSFVSGH